MCTKGKQVLPLPSINQFRLLQGSFEKKEIHAPRFIHFKHFPNNIVLNGWFRETTSIPLFNNPNLGYLNLKLRVAVKT